MELIDRRALARRILFGAAVAAVGLALSPGTASAMPLDDRIPGALDDCIPGALDDWLEKTQAVVVRPAPRRRPRGRVWRWWNRGRRVCGWRWV
jgi:hypothetical protein